VDTLIGLYRCRDLECPHEGALCYVEGSRSTVQHFKLDARDIRVWAEAIAEERATVHSKPRDLLLVPVIRSGSASDRGLKKRSAHNASSSSPPSASTSTPIVVTNYPPIAPPQLQVAPPVTVPQAFPQMDLIFQLARAM